MNARFAREIAFAKRVDHPNVVRLLGEGQLLDGRPFYWMERYRGATLGSLVRRTGPLALTFVLAVLDGVLAALEALHAAGIVHRDLQPDNVFLAEQDGRVVVKLLDLGLSHEPGVDHGDGATPDSPGALVGTLRFVAPEQALRARAITPQSDLFVAALLAHYALTAKLPFGGDTDADRLVSLVRAAPRPLRRERRDLPRAVETALQRALAKHPEARFASATAMREALGAVEPSIARRPAA
jgi:serine/threonine-protein kinase